MTASNLPTDELLALLRFQRLDTRNGAIAGEPDAIRLCGAAADEIERERTKRQSVELELDAALMQLTGLTDENARLTREAEHLRKTCADFGVHPARVPADVSGSNHSDGPEPSGV